MLKGGFVWLTLRTWGPPCVPFKGVTFAWFCFHPMASLSIMNWDMSGVPLRHVLWLGSMPAPKPLWNKWCLLQRHSHDLNKNMVQAWLQTAWPFVPFTACASELCTPWLLLAEDFTTMAWKPWPRTCMVLVMLCECGGKSCCLWGKLQAWEC